MKTYGEFGVYVIDQKFRIQYYNNRISNAFPNLSRGDYCYRSFCGRDNVCEDCPAAVKDKHGGIFYNSVINLWVEVHCSEIDWPESGLCTLVMTRELKEAGYSKKYYADLEKDALTGLYKRSAFFHEAQIFMEENGPENCCMTAVDIDNFKLFNEWYGQEQGDRFLKNIARHLARLQEQQQGIAGYMGNDDFCILMLKDPYTLARLQENITREAKVYDENAGFLPAFGMYAVQKEDTVHMNTIYDRAAVAVAAVKGSYVKRSCWYDSRMMKKIEADHILLSEVQQALNKGEITFYLQPKCNMLTGKIIGFESLVRWKHPQRGMIPPAEFIPVLERNGFITSLDQYVWDKVCQEIRRWLDDGITPLPVSINVSRIDINTINVPECLQTLIETYRLKPEYLEIEITESAYVEEYQRISGVIQNLQEAGFLVLMDDFGSGYSSLNMLTDVNVDVLKLDMRFLNMSEQNTGKGMRILDTVISMARLMGFQLVVEGVETREQVNFLIDMGCYYGQGYYFYRPMPAEACIKLMLDEKNLDFSGGKIQETGLFRMKELVKREMLSEVSLNHIVGPMVIYNICGNNIQLLKANELYHQIIGVGLVQPGFSADSLDTVIEEDREKFLKAFSSAGRELIYGSQVDVRAKRVDGTTIWLQIRLFFLYEQGDHLLYCGIVNDITQQKHDNIPVRQMTDQRFPGGYYRCLADTDMEYTFISNRFLEIMGYTRAEIKEMFDNKGIYMVHPDDRKIVADAIILFRSSGRGHDLEFRALGKRGYIWVLVQSRYMKCGAKNYLQCILTDITETVELRGTMKLLTDYMPQNIVLITYRDGVYYYQMTADGLFRSLGCTPDMHEDLITGGMYHSMVYRKDLLCLTEQVRKAFEDRRDCREVSQTELPGGKRLWIRMDARYIRESEDGVVYLCTYSDVSDIVRA